MTNTTATWYIYVIRCYDGSLYTGITTDVARRFAEHQQDKGAGAKFLRGRRPLKLVFQKDLGSRSLAQRVESKVKRLSKAKKEELVSGTALLDEIIAEAGSESTI